MQLEYDGAKKQFTIERLYYNKLAKYTFDEIRFEDNTEVRFGVSLIDAAVIILQNGV
jgi:hypothetical protein